MLMVEHLPYRNPRAYARQGDQLGNLATDKVWDLTTDDLHPLEMAARLVQEDFCFLEQDEGYNA